MSTGRVSFITCVHDQDVYAAECRRSIDAIETAGFDVAIVPVDNLHNARSLPEALNHGREQAIAGEQGGGTRQDGRHLLILCHDDVTFTCDWLGRLKRVLEQIASEAPRWAVLGPMGRRGKRFFGHAEDGAGDASHFGPLPAAVDTLDEFCLVVPADLPLRFDERLGGHHLYGVDLCIQAHEAGYGCYAVDLPCRHNSETRHRPPEYHKIKRKLQRKWMFRRRRVGRSIGTTCGRIRFGWWEGWV